MIAWRPVKYLSAAPFLPTRFHKVAIFFPYYSLGWNLNQLS